MLMRLLGAYCPKTVAGTIVGNPKAAMAPIPVFKNLRRETPFVCILPISLLPEEFYALKELFSHFVRVATFCDSGRYLV
jgi:hypothetical protein